eukprot:4810325-Amphidinium_carterae.1
MIPAVPLLTETMFLTKQAQKRIAVERYSSSSESVEKPRHGHIYFNSWRHRYKPATCRRRTVELPARSAS